MNRLLAVLLFFDLTETALAFPENVRFGYSNCSSCHVSPTGGGVTNAYGKMSSSELMSTFAAPKEENYFLPEIPKWLAVGSDIRYINVNAQSYNQKFHRKFFMQSEFELALSPIPGLWLATTGGIYNYEYPLKKRAEFEQRRSYALLQVTGNLSFRIGRFFPAYGIMQPDHRVVSRNQLGFSEGLETYNIEGSYRGDSGEIFVTGINGYSGTLQSYSEGTNWRSTSGESGYAIRATAYVGSYNLGISAQRLVSKSAIHSSYGIFAILGFNKSTYTLLQVDRSNDQLGSYYLWYSKFGYEPVKGLHLIFGNEGKQSDFNTLFWAVQLFPRPHWEFLAQYESKSTAISDNINEWIFMFHHYI